MIVHARDHNLTGSMLATKPLRYIGLISYSLYLWHWPLLEFARYYNIEPLGTPQVAAVVSISFLFAYLSYRFVEQPYRKATWSRGIVFTTGAAMTVAAIAVGSGAWLSQGWPDRLTPEALRYAKHDQKGTLLPDL